MPTALAPQRQLSSPMGRQQLETLADQVAHREGIPPAIFRSLITQESGWDPIATSPVGAKGLGQLMPGTARGLGVTNLDDPLQSLQGAARYFKQQLDHFGNVKLALAAYNAGPAAVVKYGGVPPYAETQHYVTSIMAMAAKMGGVAQLPAQAGAPSPLSTGMPQLGAPLAPHPAALGDLLQMAAPSANSVSILQRLGGMAGDAAQSSQSSIPTPGGAPQGLDPGQIPQLQLQAPAPSNPALSQAEPSNTIAGSGWIKGPKGKVQLAPNADRPGVKIQPVVLDFVKRIAGLAGYALTVGTGTNHSRMTVDGNVSDHWDGHAADIPARGQQLIHLGQLALIAAGMPRSEALKQHGGLYNVNGHQVIFNTHEGGDHTNHLHVSAR